MILRNIVRRAISAVCSVAILGAGAISSAAQDRMPPIPPEKYTEAQKQAVAEFQKLPGRSGQPTGPFSSMLRSPELLVRTVAIGSYLRFESSLDPKVRELIIMTHCRQWTQQIEWTSHYKLALQVGLTKEMLDAIADGRRPSGMSEDQEIAYDLSTEIMHNRTVSDFTYQRAVSKFGENGVLDILGLNAYYTFLAIVYNTMRTPPAANGVEPLKSIPNN